MACLLSRLTLAKHSRQNKVSFIPYGGKTLISSVFPVTPREIGVMFSGGGRRLRSICIDPRLKHQDRPDGAGGVRASVEMLLPSPLDDCRIEQALARKPAF